MSTVRMKLQCPQHHLGHCQVTYESLNERRQRLIYCLQLHFDGVRLMRCSQDGEPSHEVSFSKVRVKFEKPTGDSKTERMVRAWIEKHEGENDSKKIHF